MRFGRERPSGHFRFSLRSLVVLTVFVTGLGATTAACLRATWALDGVLAGHSGPVRRAMYTADGHHIVTAGADMAVMVWDASSFERVAVLEGPGAMLECVDVSPDGSLVVTGDGLGVGRLWKAGTGGEAASLAGHGGPLKCASFSADGRLVATGGGDGTGRIWDVASGDECALLEGHSGAVLSCSFSPDGTRVATGGSDGAARIYDAATGRCLAIVMERGSTVESVSFSSDGHRLTTVAGHDWKPRIWDASTGELLGSRSVRRPTRPHYSPDGSRTVLFGEDDLARVWRQRRPDRWWGIFWLWECWATIAFAGAFVVSLVDDSRALRAKGA